MVIRSVRWVAVWDDVTLGKVSETQCICCTGCKLCGVEISESTAVWDH
jgi:hypothetical protein